jgi:hypothetical protein
MMNTIWRCPKCGGSLDTAGRCPCRSGSSKDTTADPQQQQQYVTFTPHVPTGWKCPQCGRIHAPHVSTCPFCQPYSCPVQITWIGTTIDCPDISISPDPPNTWGSDGTYTAPQDQAISVGDPPQQSSSGVWVDQANDGSSLRFTSGCEIPGSTGGLPS